MDRAALTRGAALATLVALHFATNAPLALAQDPAAPVAPITPPAAAAPASPMDATPEHILFVTFDTLRADHLSCYGRDVPGGPVSPSVDALASSGMRFTRCFAPRGETGPSLASMMTGCYPSRHGVMESRLPFSEGVKTLPEYLSKRGWDTAAFISFIPGERALRGFGQVTVAHNDDRKAEQSAWDDAAERGVLAFLDTRARDPKPFLAWVHFFDIHYPYKPSAPFDAQFAGDYSGPMRWDDSAKDRRFNRVVTARLSESTVQRKPLDPADARYVNALYDGGIRATDVRLGRILGCLDETKLRAKTLVIFTSDHGEDLGEHNHYWYHAASVYDSVLRIPLILSGPGIPAGVSDRLVQNLDVVPTLLERLKIPVNSAMEGLSFADALWPGSAGAPPRAIAWSEWQDLMLGARTDRWKLILNPRGAHPKTPPYFPIEGDPGYFIDCFELYDVMADPRETRNVYDLQRDAHDDIVDLRTQAAVEYQRRFAGKSVEVMPEDDLELREEMEQLGYAAGGGERKDVVFDPSACRDR